MRTFDYRQRYEHILKSDIVDLVMQIHEYKGQQTLFVKAREDTLAQLQEVAKIQSTEVSNKIKGIYTLDDCLKKLFEIRRCRKQDMRKKLRVIGMC